MSIKSTGKSRRGTPERDPESGLKEERKLEPPQVRVLLVDDSADDAALLARHLQRTGIASVVRHVAKEADFSDALASGKWDVVLNDYNFEELDPLATIRLLLDADMDIPVIVVSGAIGEEAVASLMMSGVRDVVLKDNLTRLAPSMRREVGEAELRRQANDARRRMAELGLRDALTGLANRSLLCESLSLEIAKARRARHEVATLFIDIDGFKPVNDIYGHHVGDNVLVQVARRLRAGVRESDIVGRLGGDEFIVVLGAQTDLAGVNSVAEKLLDAMRQPFMAEDSQVIVSASIGVSIFPHDGNNPNSLIRMADLAMYEAKKDGGDRLMFHTPELHRRASERIALISKLRTAITNRDFVLHYQPIVELATMRVVRVEALVRWATPGFGLVSPSNFIQVAEDSGMIVALGELVLRMACVHTKAWQMAGFSSIKVAVNVSARQFVDRAIVAAVKNALGECGLGAASLDLELTESLFLDGSNDIVETLEELKSLGTTISIDDFGTGYSSLSRVANLRIDALKIDRSFVENVTASQTGSAIALAIVALASNLRVQSVAEGVETLEQLDWVRCHGCSEVQGYLIAGPMDASSLFAWLQALEVDEAGQPIWQPDKGSAYAVRRPGAAA